VSRKIHQDDERMISFYQSLLMEHGETYRALDWGSRESQHKRFEILAEIGICAGDRLLDVGCGLADFNAWLLEYRPGVEYSGIDITPDMVSTAKSRFMNANIINKTIFDLDLPHDSFDYLVASGIFFLRKENPKKYMESTIARMYQFARKGIAFNSLSAWAQKKEGDEFYAVPTEVIEFCKSLSPFVVLRHDYHPGDFTVYVYRTLTN
jgi:ubiquinone/menaquinone biosynthesis C-methylase UbiE